MRGLHVYLGTCAQEARMSLALGKHIADARSVPVEGTVVM